MKAVQIGDTVVVRSYRDEPKVARVWDCNNTTVFICNESDFNSVITGSIAAPLVGFPLRDVYLYDAEKMPESAPFNWGAMQRYAYK